MSNIKRVRLHGSLIGITVVLATFDVLILIAFSPDVSFAMYAKMLFAFFVFLAVSAPFLVWFAFIMSLLFDGED